MAAEGRDTRLLELVDEAIRSASLETHTAMPGRITFYDPATQKGTIQIQLKREYKNAAGVQTPLRIPELLDVPILFPRGGGFVMTFPIAANEPCLVLFTERDMSGWMKLATEGVPPSARRHAYSDAVAIPGLHPTADVLVPGTDTSKLVIRRLNNVTRIELSNGGMKFVHAGGDGFEVQAAGSGPFKVTAGGKVTIARGANELLAVISSALSAIAAAVDTNGDVFDTATITAINLEKAKIDSMKA